MKIMFMGTPEFAEVPLRALCEGGYNVCAVVTQPDKPKGRGYVLTPPPVKVYALENGIPVYQPERLKDGSFEAVLKEVDPDLIVVVAYGKILPSYILNYPKYGCVNIHGSLLPKYRGAAPMQRAIIDGEKQTGVTTMFMDEGMDTGDMLEVGVCDILDTDNFENIHDKLAALGTETLFRTINKIEAGSLVRTKQDSRLATIAPKIEKPDCVIDFSLGSREIHDRIRGLSPFPLSFAMLNGKMLKFVSSELCNMSNGGKAPGTVLSLDGGKIYIACGDGAIAVTGVLPEGKGRMASTAFINGRKIAVGDVFEKADI
ncbi:MAG: methionyl-tRNA formyltransferase [Ruminococcaceae bacterium]|nr:methionyl-tRNA formyltransferase [Oscillospiraceae bacterium]